MGQDRSVEEALINWHPRFLSHGIDYNDLQGILGRVKAWGDWCREWCSVGAIHERLGEEALAEGRLVSAGEAFLRAAMYYHYAQFVFYRNLEERDYAHRKKVSCYLKAAPHLVPPARRVEIPFEGITLPGYLRLPFAKEGKVPCVLLIPGLDSTKEEYHAYEEAYLKRGMATLSIDGPGQGETTYKMKMREDYERAVQSILDYLPNLEGIDTERIGIMGRSMGGYYAIRAAASDTRLRACVSSAGPYDFQHWDQLPQLTREGFLYHTGAKSMEEAKAFALRLSLQGVVERVRCPLLIVHGDKDRIIPDAHARRIYEEARCEKLLRIFEGGNHGLNNMPYKARPFVTDWMASRLG